ncbi:hypothetical protein AFL01nite_15000 [Aeromicrobium flavum]|uniref:Uncharacterized protein n=1 Tax=Aeromicrobium flavum TaxID=416568 RepID=A0A512HUQ2_9ACTN|nr:hypothetical protein [Aeromicrobium flavum]GEO89173.1 hypothetical protein AFL01nite_15000 [Aeromicrobium flavum]
MQRPSFTDTTIRRCGVAAVVLAVASLVFAPLNALARMQTADGRTDLDNPLASWWARPALDALQPWLLDFGSADTVYLTYGKFNLIALLAVSACLLATWSRRPSRLGRTERWGWRLSILSYAVMCAAQFAVYWLGVVDTGYLVMLLGMLIGIPASITLGIGLLRARFQPRAAAWVLALDLPLSVALVAVSTQALGMWPRMLVWGLIGWSLWRETRDDELASVRGGQAMSSPRRRR